MKVEANQQFVNHRVDGVEMNVLDFWKFQFSNIFMHRGEVAEYIVAKALGKNEATNDAYWTLCDINYTVGEKTYRIEVKETSDWHEWNRKGQKTQRVFSIATAHKHYNYGDKVRNNDVYVFSHHKGETSPLDLDNWDFYIIPTKIINANTKPEQKTISLGRVKRLSGNRPLKFADIKKEIDSMINNGEL